MKKQKYLDYLIHYNKWHDHTNPHHQAKIAAYITDLLRHVLPVEKQDPILEIGCSNGLALLALRNMGYSSLKGVDCNSELINIARSFSLDVELSDALEYLHGVEENHFSLIYMIDTLEHISTEQTFDLLCQVFDALSPGGRLFLQIPNADSPVGLHYRYIDWTHHCSFTVHSISHLLENAGFREITINESFLPIEPNPNDYEQDEEGRKSYSDYHREVLRRKLARRITWWQLSQFLPAAREFPLTPNMNVVAVKKIDGGPFSCHVQLESDNDNFDLLEVIDQIKESAWKIRSLQEWNSLLEDKINFQEKQYKLQQEKLQDDLLREHDRLVEWNEWLESELTRLKQRNIFKAFIVDGIKACLYLIRYPFAMAKAIRYLPFTYEKLVDRQYYGDKHE